MMTDMSGKPAGAQNEGPKWGKMTLPILAGLTCGVIAATITVQMIRADLFDALGLSEIIAIFVGAIYIAMAIGLSMALASSLFGTRFLNAEDAEELRRERHGLMASAGGTFKLGLALAVLAVSGPDSILSAQIGLILAATLMIAGTLLTIRSAKLADELMMAVSRETGNAAYYLILLVVGGWAALAHLEIAPPPAMLDILSMIWALGLLATFIATGKHGLLSAPQ